MKFMIQSDQVWLFGASLNPMDSHSLLQQALQQLVFQGVLSEVPVQLCVTEKGRPWFQDLPALHFSISHCRNHWLCAFAAWPLGIDIEELRPAPSERIGRRFFHPQEQAWLKAHPEDFFRIWTAKESVVKRSGTGIDSHFSAFSTVDENGRLTGGETYRLIPLIWEFLPGLIGTLCLDLRLKEPGPVTLLDNCSAK